ncbi:hypothetical protein GCM10023194_68390 [Planotetraspora phitsanulokensis]|uniref:Uncharacterized protein n=1 Tax=Planotetraspora phitsanulokensis TaxID=575192 RepID=A0A8J3U6J7_9ACTN|nr:hypothetical protein [Planotetraspora phitsanulokensis]GII39598.1 hypothetical protein Pph01_46010 [Planotetraspora phitsanulokensis]
MLKRLLFAVTLAASTLIVTGTAAGTAQASEPSVCASGQRTAPAIDTARPAPPCMWKGDCYMCYSYRGARWETQHCE